MPSNRDPKVLLATDELQDAEHFVTREVFCVGMAMVGSSYLLAERNIDGSLTRKLVEAEPGDVIISRKNGFGDWAFHEFLRGPSLPIFYSAVRTNSKGEHVVRGLVRASFLTENAYVIAPFIQPQSAEPGNFLCQRGTDDPELLSSAEFDHKFLSFGFDQYGRSGLSTRRNNEGALPQYDVTENSPLWVQFDRESTVVITEKDFLVPGSNEPLGVLYRRKKPILIQRANPAQAEQQYRISATEEDMPGAGRIPLWILPKASGEGFHIVNKEQLTARCFIETNDKGQVMAAPLFRAIRSRRPFIFIANDGSHHVGKANMAILQYLDGEIHFMPWEAFLKGCQIHSRSDVGHPQDRAPKTPIPSGPIIVTDQLMERIIGRTR